MPFTSRPSGGVPPTVKFVAGYPVVSDARPGELVVTGIGVVIFPVAAPLPKITLNFVGMPDAAVM
jgi:hypothetical protein